MVTVLMVAEKPMLADSIAKLLAGGKVEKRKGWNNVCSVSEYHGRFRGQNAKFKVTSTCGHINGLDFLPQFNNWEKVDPVQLFSAPTEKKEANPKMRMNEYLASEARGCDYLVLWLDCDKEGENICFEVIDAVKRNLKPPQSGNIMDVVYRAHFSAISEKDIGHAMHNLIKPNLNESLSVDARQELDLRIGCSFTRFQTKYFQGRYADLDSSCISFGPCQTPTLGFCVSRHDIITQFKSEPFWLLQLVLEAPDGRLIEPEYLGGRLFDRDVAQLLLNRIKKSDTAVVISVTKREGRKEKPIALNTVNMLKIASSSLGMSPSSAMVHAEYLYTRGYISYPRTETTEYPASFDFQSSLKQLADDAKWSRVVNQILSDGISQPRKGVNAGDHPPITPMRSNDGNISGDAARLYEYIAQHFIATLMRPCKYLSTTVNILIGGETFSINGKELIDPGYTDVMLWQKIPEESRLPDLKINDNLVTKSVNLLERKTCPPDYLTESELISLMEKHGIGTDASIPVHINTICQRNYVSVESNRRLVPTRLGIALVHGYWKVDPELVLPTMRAEVEAQLNLIAKGSADYHLVKNHTLENFRLKFIYFAQNICSMDSLFEDSFTSLAESGKPFSRCGKCRRFLKLVSSKAPRLHCSTCQETYSLPTAKGGMLKLHAERKCPLDDFDLVYWQGPGGKFSASYALCPYCFNNPPFEGMQKGFGCNLCSHSACPNSYINEGVVRCPRDCAYGTGVLVLDPQSAPKWRLTCNRCSVVVTLFKGAARVKVLEKKCGICGAQQILAEYKVSSPLPDGTNSYQGCIFCDERIQELVDLEHVYRTREQQYNRGKPALHGRSRGRGKRWRSRGISRDK